MFGIANVDAFEIEITPAMIQAGVLALLEYDPDFSNEEGVVVEMFRAMRKAIPPQEPRPKRRGRFLSALRNRKT